MAARAWSMRSGRPSGRMPGTTASIRGASCLASAHVGGGAHHPVAAASTAAATRLPRMCGGASASLVRIGDRQGRRGRPARPCSRPRPSPRRRRAASRRRRRRARSGSARRGRRAPGGPADGGRDVVQLQVEEHLAAVVDQRLDDRSGPVALNSSRPTLATPNQGRSCSARRLARRRGRRRRGRGPGGCAPTAAPVQSRVMGSFLSGRDTSGTSCRAHQRRSSARTCGRGPGIGEGGGADLDGVGAGGQQFGRVLAGGDAADADDGQRRARRPGTRTRPGPPPGGWPGPDSPPRRRPAGPGRWPGRWPGPSRC